MRNYSSKQIRDGLDEMDGWKTREKTKDLALIHRNQNLMEAREEEKKTQNASGPPQQAGTVGLLAEGAGLEGGGEGT